MARKKERKKERISFELIFVLFGEKKERKRKKRKKELQVDLTFTWLFLLFPILLGSYIFYIEYECVSVKVFNK